MVTSVSPPFCSFWILHGVTTTERFENDTPARCATPGKLTAARRDPDVVLAVAGPVGEVLLREIKLISSP
jgi:hypothetical protein